MELKCVDLNLALICGRVASSPELRQYDSGSRQLRVLVTVRSELPRKRIDVVPVTMWDPDDSLVDPGIEVGARVVVFGVVQRNFWDGFDGRRSRLEVIGQHIAVTCPADLEALLAGVGAE